ncbi:MAG: FlgD immunoglobulin-like domain containing protein [Candidatus Stygibacter frigidus]|nr:FlgD immunoglobulin-like domain containing protein [Candidatus Stygibacter frigidus]
MKKKIFILITLACGLWLFADLEIAPGFEYNMVGPAYNGEQIIDVSDTLYVTNTGSTEDFTIHMETSELPDGWQIMWCHDYEDALCHFPNFPWTFTFVRDTMIKIDFTIIYASGPGVVGMNLFWSADGIDDVQMDFTFRTEDYVGNSDTEILPAITLDQNYPNPFNPETTINYHLSNATQSELIIYNIKGEAVKSYGRSIQEAGNYSIVWDGTDSGGKIVPSGIYLYRLQAEYEVITNKMILMK